MKWVSPMSLRGETQIIHNLTVGLLGLLGGNTFTICGRTKGSVAEASGQRGAPIHTFG